MYLCSRFQIGIMMGEQIRIIAFFFSFLIITIIGNLVYAPSPTSDNSSLFSYTSIYSELQEPQQEAERTLQYLSTQNNTDIPNKTIITHTINTYDFKSALRNAVSLICQAERGTDKQQRFACFNHPPLYNRISYYIYTLEKILI